jgi:hypothetical protein
MSLAAKLRRAPGRMVTGAFILNAGLGKLNGDETTATAVHAMAVGAYPILAKIPPKPFLRCLAVAETSLGTALLLPVVPARVVGAGLMSFSSGLLTMWWRTPGMHADGSPRPTQAGTTIAKDSWLFGIGTGLLIDSIITDTGQSNAVRNARRQTRKVERKIAKIERKTARRGDLGEVRAALAGRASALNSEVRTSAQARLAEVKKAAKTQAKLARKAAKKQAKAARTAAKPAAEAARTAAESAASIAHRLTDTLG